MRAVHGTQRVRLIALLREPSERMLSSYHFWPQYRRRYGKAADPFLEYSAHVVTGFERCLSDYASLDSFAREGTATATSSVGDGAGISGRVGAIGRQALETCAFNFESLSPANEGLCPPPPTSHHSSPPLRIPSLRSAPLPFPPSPALPCPPHPTPPHPPSPPHHSSRPKISTKVFTTIVTSFSRASTSPTCLSGSVPLGGIGSSSCVLRTTGRIRPPRSHKRSNSSASLPRPPSAGQRWRRWPSRHCTARTRPSGEIGAWSTDMCGGSLAQIPHRPTHTAGSSSQ